MDKIHVSKDPSPETETKEKYKSQEETSKKNLKISKKDSSSYYSSQHDSPNKIKTKTDFSERQYFDKDIFSGKTYFPQRKHTNIPSGIDLANMRMGHLLKHQSSLDDEDTYFLKSYQSSDKSFLLPKCSIGEDMSITARGMAPWISTPSTHEKDAPKGLEFLSFLGKMYIYENIQIFDALFDDPKTSKNCFTVRNFEFKKVFYVGSVKNKSLGNIIPFTLRVVDKYSRHILSIKKRFNVCCCGLKKIDVFSPPGKLIGEIKEMRHFTGRVEFSINGAGKLGSGASSFFVRRDAEKKSNAEFEIFNYYKAKIGSISKQTERIIGHNKTSTYEDRYILIDLPLHLSVKYKALILSAGLLMNIFYLRR